MLAGQLRFAPVTVRRLRVKNTVCSPTIAAPPKMTGVTEKALTRSANPKSPSGRAPMTTSELRLMTRALSASATLSCKMALAVVPTALRAAPQTNRTGSTTQKLLSTPIPTIALDQTARQRSKNWTLLTLSGNDAVTSAPPIAPTPAAENIKPSWVSLALSTLVAKSGSKNEVDGPTRSMTP